MIKQYRKKLDWNVLWNMLFFILLMLVLTTSSPFTYVLIIECAFALL